MFSYCAHLHLYANQPAGDSVCDSFSTSRDMSLHMPHHQRMSLFLANVMGRGLAHMHCVEHFIAAEQMVVVEVAALRVDGTERRDPEHDTS